MFEGWTSAEWVGFLTLWIGLAGAVAWFAESRGRDRWNWFGVSLVFSPVVGFVALVLMGPRRA